MLVANIWRSQFTLDFTKSLSNNRRYGAKAEHFAEIARINHEHSKRNPYSQFQDEYTLEQIMKAPMIFEPLTKLQCCPTSDGAAAAVLVSQEFLDKRPELKSQAILIAGQCMATDSPDLFNDWADQAESFSCGGGCVDVTRNGEVYHFCVDGTGSMEIQGEATVSSDLAGDINIYPDGETWKSSQSAYLGSNNSHAFYVTGAKCPA